jgi:predicted PurR-regulated permease PerM
MSLLGTTAIGVASVLIAGLLVGGFLGFIVAIVVGVVLVAAWSHFEAGRKPRWRRAMHV